MSESFTWQEVETALNDMRMFARRLLAKEAKRYSWRPTALVNEALRRLHEREGQWTEVTWENKTHFFRACRLAMKSALIDRHRANASGIKYVSVDDVQEALLSRGTEYFLYRQSDIYLSFANAIRIIEHQDKILAEILEYRFILGLSLPEIAVVIGYTERHVRRLFSKAIHMLESTVSDQAGGAVLSS